MEKVFILERGEDNEGGEIKGVFASESAAVEHAKEYMRVSPVFPEFWKQTSRNNWHDGCDWIRVKAYRVLQ